MIDQDDPQNAAIAWLLARTVVFMVIGIAVFLGAGLVVQIAMSPTHDPSAALMSSLSAVVGVILGNYGAVFSWSFGSTPGSKAKDKAIAALSRRPVKDEPVKVDVVGTPDNPPGDRQ